MWLIQKNVVPLHPLSGFSAVGSAHVWGARGRWFESSNPDKSVEKGQNPMGFGLFSYPVGCKKHKKPGKPWG